MVNYDYWQKQTKDAPLFPDIAWQKPEQKALAGKLVIIGGNAHGFAAVAQAYQDAMQTGVGECRVVLPDALKKQIDPSVLDCVFAPTNHSGGINKDGLPQLKAALAWSDAALFIGDAGRNSETAIVYEQLLQDFADHQSIITRDAVDLLKSDWPAMLQRPKTIFIVTLAQLQKIFQSVYYPKTVLFSMQLAQLADALHKFTVTYPGAMVVFHQNHLLVAQNGRVSSTPWEEPMLIWRGSVAAKAAVYALQNQSKIFEALSASFI